jgi:hypothetical protein
VILFQNNVKNFYTVRIENLQTEVSGRYLAEDLAAELGFEKITGRTGVIEKTRFLEKSDGWSVYGVQWATRVRRDDSPRPRYSGACTRVYVRKIEPPKEAKAITPRRAFTTSLES